MFVYYTQMDKSGTRLMHVLGVPLYLASMLIALALGGELGAIWYFGIPTATFLGYTFLYSKALAYFSRHRPVPAWRFVLGVLSVQAALFFALVIALARAAA